MGVDLSKQSIWIADGKETGENLLKYIPKSYSASNYCAYQFNMVKNLEANKTYTIQLWDVDVSHSEKTVAQTGVWGYWGGGSVPLFNWAGSTYFTDGHADYLYKTFTVTSSQASGSGSSNLWLNIYNSVGYVAGTLNMYIGHWKLEEGDKPTPWLPNSTDNIYISLTVPFVEETIDHLLIGDGYITANNFYEI